MRDGTVGHSATTVAGLNWKSRAQCYSRNRVDDVVALCLRNVRACRLTRRQLPWKPDIDHSRIGKYEPGRNDMTIAMFVRICSALDINAVDVFTVGIVNDTRPSDELAAGVVARHDVNEPADRI
ncbi:hypothetical protein [Saccharopolyspora shandongensis]|uniref:hypothetical protein n=1 Tax=Saccharopolyspora shandongensis TaxID=418495 RepID=UPI0033FF68FB